MVDHQPTAEPAEPAGAFAVVLYEEGPTFQRHVRVRVFFADSRAEVVSSGLGRQEAFAGTLSAVSLRRLEQALAPGELRRLRRDRPARPDELAINVTVTGAENCSIEAWAGDAATCAALAELLAVFREVTSAIAQET